MIFLFHGSPLILFAPFIAGVIGAGLFLIFLIWAFTGPKRPWMLPAFILLIGLPLSILGIATESFYIGFLLCVALGSPWSIIAFVTVIASDSVFRAEIFPAFLVLNAGIIYLLARYRGRKLASLIDQ